VGFAAWSLIWSTALHETGVNVPWAGNLVAILFGGLMLGGVGLGARARGASWLVTLGLTAAVAFVASTILVTLIGPDSGTAGACSPGEVCDMDQGMGYFTGPVLLAVPLLFTVLVGRLAAAVIHRLRRS
jgi:hypothetical protein